MKKILLTKGKYALVDNEDFSYLNQFKWIVTNNGYAVLSKYKKLTYMHRVIMLPLDEKVVDHINHNPLDNQRKNLRICSRKENLRNQNIQKRSSSGYKGVSWNKKRKKWTVFIMVDKINKFKGYYKTKEEAARVYNINAIKYFGKFAHLNIIK